MQCSARSCAWPGLAWLGLAALGRLSCQSRVQAEAQPLARSLLGFGPWQDNVPGSEAAASEARDLAAAQAAYVAASAAAATELAEAEGALAQAETQAARASEEARAAKAEAEGHKESAAAAQQKHAQEVAAATRGWPKPQEDTTLALTEVQVPSVSSSSSRLGHGDSSVSSSSAAHVKKLLLSFFKARLAPCPNKTGLLCRPSLRCPPPPVRLARLRAIVGEVA